MEDIKKAFNTLLQNTTTQLLEGTIKTVNLELVIHATNKLSELSAKNNPVLSEGLKCYALALIILQFQTGKNIYTFDEFTAVIPQILEHRDYIIPCRYMDRCK